MKVLLTLIPNKQAPVTARVPHQLQCVLSGLSHAFRCVY